ncbi:MAG: choline/carnitine O-acyltransferase [Pseudomonadota bacterium]
MSDVDDARTFALYEKLPPLPLPSLKETAERYLATVEPLVDAAAFAETKRAVEALLAPGGAGEKLHAALEAKAAAKDNWLADWWDDVAYLAFPEPVLLNSNFGISVDARSPSDDPATRAAEVACRTVDFHVGLVNETFPPETVGRAKSPIDMTFFKRILGTTRVPGRLKDEIVTAAVEESRHIAVLRGGRCFAVEVLDDTGRAVSVADLAAAFQRIIDLVDAERADVAPIAVLTTERRPVWALERERLLSDPLNAASLAKMESALFGVFLDEDAYDTFNATARAAIAGKPGARWMDKTFSYVVDGRGRVSQHGEHSTADGMQHVTIFDHGCDKSQIGVFRAQPAETQRRKPDLAPVELEWRLNVQTLAAIEAAVAHFEAKMADYDVEVLHFDDFGKDVIKTLGTGPDSFVQLGYQLAFWRLHGRAPKTYESAQTRAFRLGRTETIRTTSTASKAFCQAFERGETSAEAARLLREAFAIHAQRGKEAAAGQGVDRHVLGLALMAQELGESVPEVATQEVWRRGWELSTAQLPMTALLVNNFGPVTYEGYGIGYVIQNDTVTCHVSSHRSHPDTGSRKFVAELRKAFGEMRGLLEAHPA